MRKNTHAYLLVLRTPIFFPYRVVCKINNYKTKQRNAKSHVFLYWKAAHSRSITFDLKYGAVQQPKKETRKKMYTFSTYLRQYQIEIIGIFSTEYCAHTKKKNGTIFNVIFMSCVFLLEQKKNRPKKMQIQSVVFLQNILQE